jgi:hypothetical protein
MAESIPFNDQRFNANILNKSTVAPKISSDGTSITVSTNDNSVWYRTPAWEARTGVVYGLETEVTKEGFEISVDIDDADLKQQVRVDFFYMSTGLIRHSSRCQRFLGWWVKR